MAALGLAMAHVAPDLDGRAARPGYRAADEQQVLVGDHVDDLESALGDALVAHLARAADALEHARGRGGCADRARCAHVVRAVGHGTAREVVALDGALEALALRDAGDLHGLALLEDVDLHGLADLQLAGLVAELHEVTQRRGVGLLEMAELALREALLLHLAEAELHRLIPVALVCADGGDVTRAGLDHGDAVDLAVLAEKLRHPDLLSEEGRHTASDQLDLDVHTGRKVVEPLERVDRLRRG